MNDHQQAIDRILFLVETHGKNFELIAETLNDERLLTSNKKQWTASNVKSFYYRSVRQLQDTVIQKYTSATVQDTPLQNNTVADLDEQSIKELLEMLRWWKDNGLQNAALQERRPMIHRGTTITKTIRVSKQLVEDAETKLMKERRKTGGSFSSLVELLLFQYLGQDNKYVERD